MKVSTQLHGNLTIDEWKEALSSLLQRNSRDADQRFYDLIDSVEGTNNCEIVRALLSCLVDGKDYGGTFESIYNVLETVDPRVRFNQLISGLDPLYSHFKNSGDVTPFVRLLYIPGSSGNLKMVHIVADAFRDAPARERELFLQLLDEEQLEYDLPWRQEFIRMVSSAPLSRPKRPS